MRPLFFDEIDTVWNEMDTKEVADVPGVIDRLKEKQPDLLAYFISTGSDIMIRSEREIFLFLGIMVWNIVEHLFNAVPLVSKEILHEKEEKNLDMLEYLAGEPETEFFDTVDSIMGKYNQSHLLHYLIDRLLDRDARRS